MNEYKYNYKNLAEIKNECDELNLDISFSNDLEVLKKTIMVDGIEIPNRLAIQPMEGFDSNKDGGPSELTYRRYKRFSSGGAGMIWFEASSIFEESRSNPHQLIFSENTVDEFKELVEKTKEYAVKENNKEPYLVLQLTHSGRFSKPYGDRKPIIVVHDEIMDKVVNIDQNYPVVTDDYLKNTRDKYVEAAKLAKLVGFDAIDIKACHRYLISELLAAKEREGIYGGSYENRTRLLKEIFKMIKQEEPNLTMGIRMNVSDAISSKNTWGYSAKNSTFDLEEPKKLVKELSEIGVKLINVSAGTPYYNPHITRPYKDKVEGSYDQPEHPLYGVDRLFNLSAEIQKTVPNTVVVGSGYSSLKQFGMQAAAGNIANNRHAFAGFGRQAIAYPDFANDILKKGQMEANKCCIACSKCSQLMKWGSKTGCVIRDSEVYGPVFKKALEENR
ncbi:MAG: NADH:flavin oxidoreductase [Bacillota bacterium]